MTPAVLFSGHTSDITPENGPDEAAEMATHLVNLDAMIPRLDFEVKEEEHFPPIQTVQIRDLEPSFFYNALRKPDFQRETSSWSPKKIADFVRTFLDGDLIPSIILWQAGTQIFVIDGSHRLSALIAWVHDDYGDGETSRKFFENLIPPEQQKAATALRTLVAKEIGTYAEYKQAVANPGSSKKETIERAQRLGSRALHLQWVTGDAKKAEDSFFKINQEATPIDPTELLILKSRRKASALAARSILRAGTGHKHWSGFAPAVQAEIQQVGGQIYETLFKPPLDTPIKTLDIPVGGRGYSADALPMTFDIVNLANSVKTTKPKASGPELVLQVDPNGTETVAFLKATRRIVNRISGLHPSSLGLHPALYFYSESGRYQPTSFLAVISLMKDFERDDSFAAFTKVRRSFEDFLLQHRTFPNQVAQKYGSGIKGYDRLKQIYAAIFQSFCQGNTADQTLDILKKDEKFGIMTAAVIEEENKARREFSSDAKSAVYLKTALATPLRCSICGGLIHYNSITIDHIERKADGGLGVVDNGQIAHPYCNTTFKN